MVASRRLQACTVQAQRADAETLKQLFLYWLPKEGTALAARKVQEERIPLEGSYRDFVMYNFVAPSGAVVAVAAMSTTPLERFPVQALLSFQVMRPNASPQAQQPAAAAPEPTISPN